MSKNRLRKNISPESGYPSSIGKDLKERLMLGPNSDHK
jgi:hypothetical protein